LEENTTHSGAEADEEIERAVNRVFSIDGIPAAEQWPARNDALRRRIFSSRVSVATLSKLSPVTDVPQVDLLERLFPGNPLIWAAHSIAPERADTRHLNEWLPVAPLLQFVVPSPMISRDIPAAGRSRRCKENTGERRFLIIEQDIGSFDDQSAVLLYLARFAPLALVVHSGGKSLHGWFYVAHRSEEQRKDFMRLAVTVGADRATWCKRQPVRMPEGTRSGGITQRVLLFNPETLESESRE
jgi:hypothetical protein